MSFEIPVIVYDDASELPASGTYFIVAANGLFLNKDNGVVTALVPVDKISILKELDPTSRIQWMLPQIPFEHLYKVKLFFQRVVEKYRSEACVLIYFNKTTQQFKTLASHQNVTHYGVGYKIPATEKNLDGFILVGTIHSHCDFEAFHSETDIKDESDFDGLHITIGNNDKNDFTVSACVVVNGNRQSIDPKLVIEGLRWMHKETYSFESPYINKAEWDTEIDLWFSRVTPGNLEGRIKSGRFEIQPGDTVVWNENVDDVWKTQLGYKPFKIDSIEEDPNLGLLAKVMLAVQGPIMFPLTFVDLVKD